jgi:hypothetical protein
MNDPIVEEIRKIRDAHAKKFNYDLEAIFADIQKQQERSGREFVSLPAKRIHPLNNALEIKK